VHVSAGAASAPSDAEAAYVTTAPVGEVASAVTRSGSESRGAARSTRFPVTCPAVTQLPTASQTCAELVAASAVSAPAATSVLNATIATLTPAPPSATPHYSLTLAACHTPSALGHETDGARRSTRIPGIGPAVEQLPSVSQTEREPSLPRTHTRTRPPTRLP
jgi:hypothetical protein